MFALTNRPEMGARLYAGLIEMATDAEKGTDSMQLIQHMAGVLVETYLVFDNSDEAMEASFAQMARMLGCEPFGGKLGEKALPPANIIDIETEKGRAIARNFFEEWLDCSYEFHSLMLIIIHNILVSWEEDGQPRAESFRLLIECTKACLGNEIAAQELCDVLIDKKMAVARWSLGDCITALSAIAGRKLALSLSEQTCMVFSGADLPEQLDQISHVMTQEAIRLGVPAGSDWRFGLAANDVPVNAPVELINGVVPYCRTFFDAVQMKDNYSQAVACAKAAGRMLAVASGGEMPELEPVIAKPLAMSAMTETYKSVCMQYSIASY